MRVAGVDPAACDEGAIGFRLAPRINASGRLGRPEAALSLLLLTDDPAEAKRLAEQLEDLNRERQAVEERILRAATAEIESWPEPRRRHRGYVVAGEDWHEGVIGIVASRLVERFGRPVVLIAGSASGGDWKGSGRAGRLVRPARRAHRVRRASRALRRPSRRRRPRDPPRARRGLRRGVRRARGRRPERRRSASADTCRRDRPRHRARAPALQELARLAPFGLGNPGITLLVDDCELTALDTVGEGKHLRFRVRQRGRDAGSAIAFGFGAQIDRYRRVGHYDVAFRLQENRWNGTVSPQLVVRRIFDTDERYEELRAWFAEQWRRGAAAWTPEVRAVFDELGLTAGGDPRSLLESETFRRLLEEEPPLAQAA